jgi:hypothetical protein
VANRRQTRGNSFGPFGWVWQPWKLGIDYAAWSSSAH